MTFCVDRGLCLYWATSRWSPVEIYEAHSVAKTTNCVPPLAEWAEYHFFHREKVELYLAELYNKIGELSSFL
jgi:potassium voltage-gated channel Shaker-related subfamily A beta protein 3